MHLRGNGRIRNEAILLPRRRDRGGCIALIVYAGGSEFKLDFTIYVPLCISSRTIGLIYNKFSERSDLRGSGQTIVRQAMAPPRFRTPALTTVRLN